MTQEKKTPKTADEGKRRPSWRDKHGRPEILMPRSYLTDAVEPPRTTPPAETTSTSKGTKKAR